MATKLNLLAENKSWNKSVNELFEEVTQLDPHQWEVWLQKHVRDDVKK